MKLSGIMIGSDQPTTLGDFYTKLFGNPGWHQDDWYGFDVGGGTLMIGPHSEVHGTNNDAPRLMISLEDADVPALFAVFIEKGAKEIAKPYQPDADKSPDIWLATVADPDGNYIQLASPWDGNA